MTFVVAILATLASCPWVVRSLVRRQVLDVATGRSSHKGSVPRGGGIAILIGVTAGLVAGRFWRDTGRTDVALLAVAGCFALLGWLDDLRSRDAFLRLAVQIGLAASFAVASAGSSLLSASGILLALIVTAWVMGFVNTFNFMDGINGIVAGTALVISLAIAAGSFQWGRDTTAYLALAVAGASAGFLVQRGQCKGVHGRCW